MTADDRRALGARLHAERMRRGWVKPEMARRLAPHVSDQCPDLDSLLSYVKRWEAGKVGISERYRLAYAAAFGMDMGDLFRQLPLIAGFNDDLPSLALLVAPGPLVGQSGKPSPAFSVESVEALLRRLYRLDAEFGGNELCLIIGDQVQAAANLFDAESLKPNLERRLFSAVAGLTQIAGWLSLDANRHGDANRYLAATVYAAHEIDDLGLAGHALGYMSLHAFYRDQPKKALALAETASDLARSEGTPRTQATLHNRAARAHARLGEADACRRRLDLAEAAYAADRLPDDDPQWIGYVSDVEIAAQRGACFLDLKRPNDAVTSLTEAIDLVQTTAPEHMRDLAHYKTRLASAHLQLGDPEQAVQVAAEAHTIAEQIGSARVNERFSELVTKLEQHDVPEVHALVEAIRPQ